MKKLSFIVMAGLLVLGLTQCKKENINENTNIDEGDKVTITLMVGGGAKGHVVPDGDVANVVYDNGDKILVGYNNAYIGELTYNGSAFTGNLSISQSGDQPLHFYYLAGVSQDVTENQCTVNISDQSSRLGIISYGTSNENYSSGVGEYTAYLRNQCGLVKFTTTDVDGAITISGVNNQMTVNFAEQTFTPGNSGNVTLNGTSGTTRWAILLPGSGTTVTASATGYSDASGISIPAIANNTYIAGDDAISIELTAAASAPTGAINGKFTVNAGGKQVYFSKGNLQFYRRISYLVNGQPYWRFASEQYEIFGANGHNQGFRDEYLAANYPTIGAANRDVFGWATSGWHDPNDDGNRNYEPWSIEFFSNGYTVANNTVGYGPSDGTKDITGEYANYDWGVYNSQEGRHIYVDAGITEATGSWRTLSLAEWNWVIGPDGTPGVNCRTASTVNGVENARFAKAYLNVTISANAGNANDASRRIHGLILFPDTYVHPSDVALPTGINDKTNTSWNANAYTAEEWAKMENAGAIFLPAAGQRNGYTTFSDAQGPAQVVHVNENGYYWSTTHDPNDINFSGTYYPPCSAYCMQFSSGSINTTNSGFSRNYGHAVRLVQDVE